MYLEKLSLHNYRGIRDMEIEFDRHLNVFVGDNGCGKTSIIDAIRKCLNGTQVNLFPEGMKEYHETELFIPEHDVYFSKKNADCTLSFYGATGEIVVKASSKVGGYLSSLEGKFSRNTKVKYLFLTAERQKSDWKPSGEFYSGSGKGPSLPPQGLSKALDLDSPASKALKWVKAKEDEENAAFRWHVEDGEDKSSFELDKKLQAVKKAISNLTGFSRFAFSNSKNTFEAVKTNDVNKQKFAMEQLSLGEKIFLELSATIACDVVESETDENDLLGAEHLIIIDEIDLHLHPKWQRRIVPALRETFPNCQFIITTHSPQVLSEVPAENIFSLYRDENGDIQYEKPERSRGLSSSDILDEVMDLPQLPPKLEALTDKVYDLIEDEEFEKAKQILTDIENEYGEIPALIKARTYLKLSE